MPADWRPMRSLSFLRDTECWHWDSLSRQCVQRTVITRYSNPPKEIAMKTYGQKPKHLPKWERGSRITRHVRPPDFRLCCINDTPVLRASDTVCFQISQS